MTTIEEVRTMGRRMHEILGFHGSAVGVRLLATDVPVLDAVPAAGHRYCQALMRARRGDHVVVDATPITCPAAARAFGFRPLPPALESGKGLIGFGITAEEAIGRAMFEQMPVLEEGAIRQLDLFPLDRADAIPDIVVVEDEVERLMWIVLAYMHATGGKRVQASTAVLQATCVDSTIIPYLEHRLNYGLGCYGCRDATDIGPNETVIGFPAWFLPAIVEHLEYLHQRALPHSREKHAFFALKKALADEHSCGSM